MDKWGEDPYGLGGQQPSRRDLLEIDQDGRTTSEKKQERQQKQQEQWDDMQRGGSSRNPFSRFKNQRTHRRGGRGQQHNDGSWFSVLFALAIIAFLIYLVWASMNGGLSGFLRSFNSSNEANQAAFMNAFHDLERVNKEADPSLKGTKQDWEYVYDKNRLYRVEDIHLQVYPEYMIYVYTGEQDKDGAFNEFVNDWEMDSSRIPIYRLEDYILPDDHYLRDIVPAGNPYFVFFKGTNDVYSKFDSVLDNPEYFNQIEEYTHKLKHEYDELQRDRIGTYGQSQGFKQLTEPSN